MMRTAARYAFFVMVFAFSFSILTSVVPTSYSSGSTKITHAQGTPEAEEDPTDPKACGQQGGLAWVICPFTAGAIEAAEGLDNMINTLLTVETHQLFDTSDSESSGARYKQAWSVFRSIALGIVIIAALIIIISTAFGLEILDAYTIRKLLPRTLIAIVGITLSWNILEFLITFTNDVGNGVRALIYIPFEGMNGISFAASTNIFMLLIGGGAMFALGIIGFLSLIVTALLAIIIAFLVLVLRELIIITLVLFAPIGIACLILPNTRKGWQLWQNTLTVMLVVFPIISAFIAMGRVFSLTVSNGADGGDVVNQLIAFAAFLLPYFMLPFAFRMAGGMMATLGGLTNDSSRGAFDRLKNFRGNRMQKVHDKRMRGKTWLGTGRSGGMYRRAAAAGENGSWNPTRKGRARWKQEDNRMLDLQSAKTLEEGGNRAFNDDDASELAARKGMTRSSFMDQYQGMGHSRKEAEAALYRMEQATGTRVGSDAMRISAQKFRVAHTNTAYAEGEAGITQMQNELSSMVDSGLITSYDAAGWMKENKGRAEFRNASYGETVDFVEGKRSARQQIASAFRGSEAREIMGSHQNSVVTFAEQSRMNFESAVAQHGTATQALKSAQASGDTTAIAAAQAQIDNSERQVDIASADLAGVYDAMGHTSPKKAQEFADNVFGQAVKFDGGDQTVRAIMERSRTKTQGPNGENTFRERRREYDRDPATRGEGGPPIEG